MEKKINIAELLKNCPKGMELDCASYNNVSFDKISDDKKATYPIFCYITDEKGNRSSISFTENGCESKRYGAKCVIFPKGKTTWEGFHRPFKDGDIVAFDNPHRINNLQLFIFKDKKENNTLSSCYLMLDGNELDLEEGMYYVTRLATEEEKQKLFQAIKDNGYKWNADTKTLEKLVTIFKVGDKIRCKNDNNEIRIIDNVFHNGYTFKGYGFLSFKNQDEWELVPNKFDITTLKPFDKVLVRSDNKHRWSIQFFERLNNVLKDAFVCMRGERYHQCVPFEGNEHLLNTANDCDRFFKVWEES